MRILEEKLDCKLIECDRIIDNRGWFQIAFNHEEMNSLGIRFECVCQLNHSLTMFAGTVRGLNYQTAPYEQAKIVRCVRGKLYSVAVNIRKSTKSFGKWCAFELNNDNHVMYIPRGYAHGFIVNEDNTELEYLTDNKYSKAHAKSIRFDDPTLGIDWTRNGSVSILQDSLSEKNMKAPLLDSLR